MPYKFKKEGNKYIAYNEAGQKVGCAEANKESLRKCLTSLRINVKENNINEDEKQLRDQQIKTAIQDIKAKELALKDAKNKLIKLKNRTIPISEVSLFDFHTDLKERKMEDGSEDPQNDKAEPAADSPEDVTDADKGSDADSEDTSTNKPAKVKFNLARVKQYNTYPIGTNNGIITGATKEGLSVLVGDSTITVSYKDIIE